MGDPWLDAYDKHLAPAAPAARTPSGDDPWLDAYDKHLAPAARTPPGVVVPPGGMTQALQERDEALAAPPAPSAWAQWIRGKVARATVPTTPPIPPSLATPARAPTPSPTVQLPSGQEVELPAGAPAPSFEAGGDAAFRARRARQRAEWERWLSRGGEKGYRELSEEERRAEMERAAGKGLEHTYAREKPGGGLAAPVEWSALEYATGAPLWVQAMSIPGAIARRYREGRTAPEGAIEERERYFGTGEMTPPVPDPSAFRSRYDDRPEEPITFARFGRGLAQGVENLVGLPVAIAGHVLGTMTGQADPAEQADIAVQTARHLPDALAQHVADIVTHPVQTFVDDPIGMALDVMAPVGAARGAFRRRAATAEAEATRLFGQPPMGTRTIPDPDARVWVADPADVVQYPRTGPRGRPLKRWATERTRAGQEMDPMRGAAMFERMGATAQTRGMAREARAYAAEADALRRSVPTKTLPSLLPGVGPDVRRLLRQAERASRMAHALDRVMQVLNPLTLPGLLLRGGRDLVAGIQSRFGVLAPTDIRAGLATRLEGGASGTRWENLSPVERAAATRAYWRGRDRPELARMQAMERAAAGEVSAWFYQLEDHWKRIAPADRPTVNEGLAMEHARITPHVRRDMARPAGQRFEVIDPQAPPWVHDWVRTNNYYDAELNLLDFVRTTITAESVRVGLLRPSQIRDEVYWPNVYETTARKQAAVARRTQAGWDPHLAQQAIEETGRYAEPHGALTPSPAANLGRIKGKGSRTRTLAHRPLEERRDLYGMADDLQTTFFVGYVRQKTDIAHQRMWQRLADDPNVLSRVRREGWVMTANPRRPGGTRPYGDALPEVFWMNPDVYWDHRLTQEIIRRQYGENLGARLLYGGGRMFKQFKTTGAPSTISTNIWGNVLVLAPMARMSILNPVNWKHYRRAGRELLLGEHGPAWRQWIQAAPAGAHRGLTRADVLRQAEIGVGALASGVRGNAMAFVEGLGRVGNAILTGQWRGAGRGLRDLARLAIRIPGAFYNANDELHRFAYYLKNRRQPIDPELAADAYQRYGDYHNLSGFARVVSGSPLGQPFVAYTARMVPEFKRFMEREPARAALWSHAYKALSDANLASVGITDEMEEGVRAGLPKWDRNRLGLLARVAPWAVGADGKLNFMDLVKYHPLAGLLPQAEEEIWGVPFLDKDAYTSRLVQQSSPWMSTLAIGAGGWDPLYRRPIADPTDSPSLKGEKTARALGDVWLPPVGTGLGFWDRRIEAAEAGVTRPRSGAPKETPTRARLAAYAGVRAPQYDIRGLLTKPEEEEWFKVRQAQKAMRSIARRYAEHSTDWSPDVLRRELRHLASTLKMTEAQADEMAGQLIEEQRRGDEYRAATASQKRDLDRQRLERLVGPDQYQSAMRALDLARKQAAEMRADRLRTILRDSGPPTPYPPAQGP